MSRLLAIADKELRQVRRDPLTLAMMVVMPVMQLLLFGYAINNDVRHMPTVVLDHDHSSRSRDFVRSMEVTGYYDIVGHVRSYEEVERAFRAGRAKVAVVFPDGYGAAVAARRGGTVQVIVDGEVVTVPIVNAPTAPVGSFEGVGNAKDATIRDGAATWYLYIAGGPTGTTKDMTDVAIEDTLGANQTLVRGRSCCSTPPSSTRPATGRSTAT